MRKFHHGFICFLFLHIGEPTIRSIEVIFSSTFKKIIKYTYINYITFVTTKGCSMENKEKFIIKNFREKRAWQLLYNDTIVAEGQYLGCGAGKNIIYDNNLYNKYLECEEVRRFEILLSEEKYSEISEKLILKGLQAGTSFGGLDKNPLWKNYINWYKNLRKTIKRESREFITKKINNVIVICLQGI